MCKIDIDLFNRLLYHLFFFDRAAAAYPVFSRFRFLVREATKKRRAVKKKMEKKTKKMEKSSMLRRIYLVRDENSEQEE